MSQASRLSIALGLATIYLIWGSTYLAIRFGVETIPPFLLAGVRFVIGGALFYWWARARGAPKPKKKHWLTTLVIGTLLAAGGNGMVTWAEETVPSGLTALLISMVPLWIVLIDWLRPRGTRPGGIVIFGLILGFGGVAFLINPTDIGGFSEIDKVGAAIITFATISWASGSVYSRYAPQPDSQPLSAGMQMLTGGAVLLLLGFMTGEAGEMNLQDITAKSLLALAYLTLLGSFAFGVYIWLFKATTPARVATYAYVNPVIALFLGNILADETLSSWAVGCSVVIIAAVAIIITAKSKARQFKPIVVAEPASTSSDLTIDRAGPVCECD